MGCWLRPAQFKNPQSIRQQQASAIAIDATTHEALDEVLPPVENPLIETPGLGHSTEIAETTESDDILPHRKRRRSGKPIQPPQEEALPLDASNQLTTAATALPSSAHIRRRLATYLSLSKPRLSVLVILTTTSAYSLYPIPDILASTVTAATTSFSTSTLTLLFLTTGTFLSCACANTLNMLAEPKYDALMSRTRKPAFGKEIDHTTSSCPLCNPLRYFWTSDALVWYKSYSGRSVCSQHNTLCRGVHPDEADVCCQYLGWRPRRRHPSFDGMVCCGWRRVHNGKTFVARFAVLGRLSWWLDPGDRFYSRGSFRISCPYLTRSERTTRTPVTRCWHGQIPLEIHV